MYTKFPFFSIALMYANSLNMPVSILFGVDRLYWVVERHMTEDCLGKGCVLINSINETTA